MTRSQPWHPPEGQAPAGPGRLLVADDEASIRLVLRDALEHEGYRVDAVATGSEALDALRTVPYDVALVDIRMPDIDGLELLSKVRAEGLDTEVIMMTAHGTMANAVEAMKRGAHDYVIKPFHLDEVIALVRRALDVRQLTRDLERLRRELGHRYDPGQAIIGRSPAMQAVYKIIGRVAATDAPVLIEGESGTGKELTAKAIHYNSRRWRGPFVVVNCAAVPHDLLESELFGHERGAFTGAVEQRQGKFELAAGGTLFLDEVAELPLDLQAKLLHVVQRPVSFGAEASQGYEFRRVGGRDTVRADVRIISATNRSLEAAVKTQNFREDLYYRLAVLPLRLPPLRERRDDIPALIHFFIDRMHREMGLPVAAVSPAAEALLRAHDWPGNVRELENTLLRAAALARGKTLVPEDFTFATAAGAAPAPDSLEDAVRRALPEEFSRLAEGSPGDLLDRILRQVERPAIELALARTGGNQLRAAALLGINRNTLRKRIRALGIAAAEDDEGR